jgi:hypothetical protein
MCRRYHRLEAEHLQAEKPLLLTCQLEDVMCRKFHLLVDWILIDLAQVITALS